MKEIINPDLLIISRNGIKNYGADQAWYRSSLQRYSGCGPTVCSNILLYYARSGKFDLSSEECNLTDSKYISDLMDLIWEYITPGRFGVNSTSIFKDGLHRFADKYDLPLQAESFNIPKNKDKRPEYDKVSSFISNAIEDDHPVAFLNLSNGSQDNIESWHWVMIVGIDGEFISLFDQGRKKTINLREWLKTSKLGGGFVSISFK